MAALRDDRERPSHSGEIAMTTDTSPASHVLSETDQHIADALQDYWGSRCPDFDPECATCNVWARLDGLLAAALAAAPAPSTQECCGHFIFSDGEQVCCGEPTPRPAPASPPSDVAFGALLTEANDDDGVRYVRASPPSDDAVERVATGLLPCPFCGSANIDPEGWASQIAKGPACDDCGATAETVDVWNTRPAAAPASPPSGELPDDLRVPLHGLQADREYLVARLRKADDEETVLLSESIRERLSQIEEAAYRLNARAAISAMPASDDATIDALMKAGEHMTAAQVEAEKLREALREELTWHEAQAKALSKQPPSTRNEWDRHVHREHADAIRKALGEQP
jgi:hypothetical protein